MSEIYIDDKILNSLVAVMLIGPFVFVLIVAQQAQTSCHDTAFSFILSTIFLFLLLRIHCMFFSSVPHRFFLTTL